VPNKTIYVSDGDLQLYDQAQSLAGGNLSSAIATALRRFVEVEHAHQAGLDEVTVVVGPPGSQRKKRFFGVRLVRWQYRPSGSQNVEIFSVYRTQGGRFAVHRQVQPNWEALSDPSWWFDAENWKSFDPRRHAMAHAARWGGGWHHGGEAVLDIYETLADMEPQVPPELFEQLQHGGEEPPLEDLDI